MFLLYTDESNLNPGKDADFFIYGGLIIQPQYAKDLSDRIEKIRREVGYGPKDRLKFTVNTNERPKHISRDKHLKAKQKVLEAAAEFKARFLVSVVYHQLAKDPNKARRFEINRICMGFNSLLAKRSTHGLVLIDNFSDPKLHDILEEKFNVGLTSMPYGDGTLRLKNILGFHLSTTGGSHFSSLLDVVLGSFRYAVNNRNVSGRAETVGTIMAQIAPLFARDSSTKRVRPEALFFSPKSVGKAEYREAYDQLREFLASYGVRT